MSAATMPITAGMPKPTKGKTPKPTPVRVKPMRMVRIPEAFAAALERRAAKEYSDLTEQLRIAVKEFLEKHSELPPPSVPPP